MNTTKRFIESTFGVATTPTISKKIKICAINVKSEYSSHSHYGIRGRILYTIDGIPTEFCTMCECTTKRPDINACYLYCDECAILYPGVTGAHAKCKHCEGVCTGVTFSHEYFHLKGDCKCCTSNEGEFHQYCYICKICLPYTSSHSH